MPLEDRSASVVSWPPKVSRGPKTRFSVDGTPGHISLDGQPTLIPLKRLSENDRSIRGEILNECCGCGMVHLYTFEVVSAGQGFLLIKRPHVVKPGRKPRTRKK